MPNFFSIIVDKSALQALTAHEAEWLFHHFRVNVPPVFFAELLGDLKKEKGFSTGTAAGDVKMLSSKIESAFIDLNADAHALVVMELKGATFPLDGRPVLERVEYIRDPRGGFGAYIDQTPMQRVMDRWQAGDFKGMEEAFAKVWRDQLAAIDLQKIIASTKHVRDKSCDTPQAVMKFVNWILFKPNQNYANLVRWMDTIGFPSNLQKEVVARWKASGRPPSGEFAPYTAHAARLEVFFYLAVAHHVISTRSSNRIDMEYFMYLPFTRVFASSDKLHADLFPVFAREDQVFISGADLKASLAEMADYYDQMAEEKKSEGSFTYADYPPVHMDNAVTKAYDKVMPNWRDGANQPRPPRDPEADKKILEHLRPMMDAIKAHNRRMGRE
ncbi:hypothetical protein C5748_07385 [Phyllobacterium phragmitis]|uniref:Uncharacterized protein n=1 Tax=Phyllobacterium phragmitis TaxID=2670329 RepID=A0A2S9IV32_9HYPH|nr:hypothetical protein [Phyllobacterium phragmitis]PRD44393.1 hypothetical protein C5748_07385 [Phyllobacterium phragmitis]